MTEGLFNVIPAKVMTELGLAEIQALELKYKLSVRSSPRLSQNEFRTKNWS